MNDYTIYCTEEQTKRAFELGAPIVRAGGIIFGDHLWFPHKNEEPRDSDGCADYDICDDSLYDYYNMTYYIPTAEQMIGWLEEQGLRISISGHSVYISQLFDNSVEKYFKVFYSRKEATLAAIDAALECLTNNLIK